MTTKFAPFIMLAGLAIGLEASQHVARADDVKKTAAEATPLYVYTLNQKGTPESYDEATAATCLQGLINRTSPSLYLLSTTNARPRYWLDMLTKNGRWLEGRETRPVADLDALAKLAGSRLKGAVIWDPAVPATVNVATTIAGVCDGVVFSPEYADRYLKRWNLPVIKDLRGMFTGAETGSKKNDAYRWAIREYLQKGRCSSQLLCLFQDTWRARPTGDIQYVVNRDWAVKRQAFVFDLSPWGDERPMDDPEQKLGTDLETYQMILAETLRQSAGKHMTEMAGFFHFLKYSNVPEHKSAHEGIPTEWRTVWLISPYNVYQNTLAAVCHNQSLHSQSPWKPVTQRRPAKKVPLENKTYLCIFMGDYDSVFPIYEFLPKFWDSPSRGKLPLMWGVNPNLIETCPDLITYFYSTASANDTFVSDASAAGYMDPSQIRKEYLPLFITHNRHYFRETDMTIAPFVVDQNQPSVEIKNAFLQFAPDGFATDVQPMGYAPFVPDGFPTNRRHVWKGMPVMQLEPGQDAGVMANAIQKDGGKLPAFHLFRVVWESPDYIVQTIASLRQKCPGANIEVLDPYNFFALFKESYEQQNK
jgi:hypothetical protein